MKFESALDAASLRWFKGLVECRRGVRGEIVQDDADFFCFRVVGVDEVAHALSEISCRATIGYLCVAPRTMGIDEDEYVCCAVTHVS
jgi:hypothetical protein